MAVVLRIVSEWCKKIRVPDARAKASMFLVPGGAGFIGSNVVAGLNEAGRSDVAVNDTLGSDGKWRNLQKRQLADFIFPADLFAWVADRHLGALLPPRG